MQRGRAKEEWEKIWGRGVHTPDNVGARRKAKAKRSTKEEREVKKREEKNSREVLHRWMNAPKQNEEQISTIVVKQSKLSTMKQRLGLDLVDEPVKKERRTSGKMNKMLDIFEPQER